MKLPNAEKAVVSETKLRAYLLSTDHPIGRFKARFFAGLGFSDENWTELRDRLLEIALGDAELGGSTEYGQKYLVSGTLEGPSDSAGVITVWIILTEGDAPDLVTVYPR